MFALSCGALLMFGTTPRFCMLYEFWDAECWLPL